MAGFMSGMIGVGAGLVIVPVLLLINVHPRVAAATSGMMYFFISSTSILTTILSKILPLEVIFWFVGLALIGVIVISNLIYWIVRKYSI